MALLLAGPEAGRLLQLPGQLYPSPFLLYPLRWQKRLKEKGPKGLEEESRCPKRHRQPTWSPELAQAVLKLRAACPPAFWGDGA